MLLTFCLVELAAAKGPAGDTSRPSPVQVLELKTEHTREPLGIETPQPRFRWLLESAERSQLQTAYQIQVSGSLERLLAGQADQWDSGKVMSDNSVEAVYEGEELKSAERYYWRVRVWDRQGRASAYSPPSSFEMGLLNPDDWQGQWIATAKDISAPLFRREFALDTPVRRARVYVSGLGYYELSINGEKVGDRVLDPATTYYHNTEPLPLQSRVLYATYDVTTALQEGANAVGVMLGQGWYSGDLDSAPGSVRVASYGDRPQLILQLNVELADGRTFRLVSDASWKSSPGPITYNSLIQGESYDAQREQPGWDRPGFNDASWTPASPAEAPSGELTAQLLPPSQVMATLPAINVIEHDFLSNTAIYDFGQNFTGWARLAVSGPRGATLTLTYAQRLYPEDKTLDTRSNRLPDHVARQTDTYILKGEGTEIWEPRFTLHSFRYVQVRSQGGTVSEKPAVQRLEGRVVHSAVESTGAFASSNELLNQIHRNIQWTFLSSLQGIPQDAPERSERIGWLGDTGFTAEDYLYNYDMVAFWEKWLKDIRDGQHPNGAVHWNSPSHWRFATNDYLLWPSWQSTYPLLVWYLYQYYGDLQVVRDHYVNVRKLVDYFSAAAEGHLIANEPAGDHLEPQADGFSRAASQHTPAALTANAYYYYSVVLLARMAERLDRARDAKRYQRLSRDIQTAFNRRFWNSTTHQYATGSQTSNALPLHVGLVPPERVPALMKNLIEDIVTTHDDHLTTGIIGSDALVQVLPKYGASEVMYKLATQTTYPSLGHQVMMGATTVCESYECRPSFSQNMKMLGSLDKFFHRNLAGIQSASPGYRRARVAPQPVGDLRHVSATQKTVRGPIAVEWTRADASFELEVTIPAGVQADIAVPMLGMRNVQIREGQSPVWESNAYVSGVAGIAGARAEADEIIFQVGSGNYRFVLTSVPTEG
jgi:alpha-L-rhamnosidase